MKIAILGATGSIGSQSLDVVSKNEGRCEVISLVARTSWEKLIRLGRQYQAKKLCLTDEKAYQKARDYLVSEGLEDSFELLYGDEGVDEIVADPEVEVVISSFVGMAGLRPTLKALESGKRVALANKESLVVGGALLRKTMSENSTVIVPIDSEHSALWQCMHGQSEKSIWRIILTASGGPFREWSRSKIERARPQDALKHPTWDMGNKITIDSSTLMNKGLEVIEAHQLYQIPLDQIDVWIHPQSIVHSMVEYKDGSVLAQLSPPDMRLPIQYALSYPDRWEASSSRLSLEDMTYLNFSEPRHDKFPCLGLAYEAARRGGGQCCVLNAANEIAVELFLQEKIHFYDIPRLVEMAMDKADKIDEMNWEEILALDSWTREFVMEQTVEKVVC